MDDPSHDDNPILPFDRSARRTRDTRPRANPSPGGLPDLSSLFEEEKETASDPELTIPPELQTYLSPDLWRRLNNPCPPRGVLFNALERVRSVLYLISTYLPANLVQDKMRRSVPGLVKGEMLRGTLLFSDVSGFTALSERFAALGPGGAEQLTTIMNRYFAAMLEVLAWSGGILLKFAGDATLVYFPEQEDGQQAAWAVRAGWRMLQAMSGFTQIETPNGKGALSMKVGVATGEYLAASIGSAERMEYIVLGPAVTQTMAAESAVTGAGQLVVNEATQACLDASIEHQEHGHGWRRITAIAEDALGNFEIKAETRRARGAIPWNASPQATLAQIEVAMRQIQSLTPYLAPELIERIVVHSKQRRMESEYRPTTVLFGNFTGPEALLELWGEAGVPRLTGLLSAYFNAMHEVISEYGGIISRIDPYSSGTKMLVLFGAPVAHEDDPQRAVSAALAMNLALETVNESWLRKFQRHLPQGWNAPLIQHRLGITCGETFAGQVGSATRREYTVMGDEVNLAARLMSAADMGQILLSQRVEEAVSAHFVLTPLSPIKVKGKTEPIPIYQVDGAREGALIGRARGRMTIVERQAEQEQAGQILQQALSGKGGLLSISGPTGIGKSHLADMLVNQAWKLGAAALLHACRSYTSRNPYACWAAVLRSAAGITSLDYRPEAQQQKLQRLLEGADLPRPSMESLARLVGLKLAVEQALPDVEYDVSAAGDDDLTRLLKPGKGRGGRTLRRRTSQLDLWDDLEAQSGSGESARGWPGEALSACEQDRVRKALLGLLGHLSAASPLLVFFEDAHWMDDESRELLISLSDSLHELPVLILLAQRSDGPASALPGQVLHLEPLGEQATRAFVAHILIDELARVIYEQSGGVPLFVDEITRWFQRTHNIRADELKSVLQGSDLLQKLVLSGLESLPEAQREVVKAASVMGEEFSRGELSALLGDEVDPVTLSRDLRHFVEGRLLVLVEAGADARYAFRQSLVRDVLYNSLPFEQRRDLHGKVAEYLSRPPSGRRALQARIAAALDAGPAGDHSVDPETIALHYQKACLWLQAADKFYEAAQRQAIRQSPGGEAPRLFQCTLDCLKNLPADELDPAAVNLKVQACIHLGDGALLAQDYPAALRSYQLAQDSLSNAEDGGKLREALSCRLALVLVIQKKARDAEGGLRIVINEAEHVSSMVALTLAWLLWRDGRAEADEWIDRARKQLDPANSPWEARAKVLLDDFSGDLPAAERGYLELGSRSEAALAALRLGDQLLSAGQAQPALEAYQRAANLWKDAGLEVNGSTLAWFRQAEALWTAGEQEAALAALAQALETVCESAPLLRTEGRAAIRRAIKGMETGSMRRWPGWRWQAYDDALRIRALFHPL